MKLKWFVSITVTACFLFGVGLVMASAAKPKDISRISKEELKEKLGNPDVVILDVRYGKDWEDSDMKIKGAVRKEPKKVDDWIGSLEKDKIYVLYCA